MSNIYIVTDRNNKDRENPIVDEFATRAEADQFVNDSEYGDGYEIEEVSPELLASMKEHNRGEGGDEGTWSQWS